MKVEITKDTFGFWNFTIISGNNQVRLPSSNGYTRRRDAVRAVKGLAKGLQTAEVVFVV